MKREIKFRGKRLDNGEWVYGDFRSEENCIAVPCYIRHFGIGYDVYPVDPDTVGQYTGLKDKNGREIYEGDIIKCLDKTQHYISFYDKIECSCKYYPIKYHHHKKLSLFFSFEINQLYIDKYGAWVVGNIFDNPELLKEKKMDDKTLKELTYQKRQLEAEITELIDAFEGEFAVQIEDISIQRDCVMNAGGQCVNKKISVETKVVLP